jgi:hypothetical protein
LEVKIIKKNYKNKLEQKKYCRRIFFSKLQNGGLKEDGAIKNAHFIIYTNFKKPYFSQYEWKSKILKKISGWPKHVNGKMAKKIFSKLPSRHVPDENVPEN